MAKMVRRTVSLPEEIDAIILHSLEAGEEFDGKPYTYAAAEFMRRGVGAEQEHQVPTVTVAIPAEDVLDLAVKIVKDILTAHRNEVILAVAGCAAGIMLLACAGAFIAGLLA